MTEFTTRERFNCIGFFLLWRKVKPACGSPDILSIVLNGFADKLKFAIVRRLLFAIIYPITLNFITGRNTDELPENPGSSGWGQDYNPKWQSTGAG